MSGMLLIRCYWFVGVLIWGAVFTFVDIAVHRSPLPVGTADWLLTAYEHAAVLLTGLAFLAMQLRNWRLDAALGTPFVAFKTSFLSRLVFCTALVAAVGLGSAAMRVMVGQPAFPPISAAWLYLPLAAVAFTFLTAPRQVQHERQNG